MLFRVPILLLLLAGFNLTVPAQGKKFELPADFTITLDLAGKTTKKTGKLPFKNIVVKDYRFDTTKVGYFKTRTQVVLNASPSMAFTTALNHYFRNLLDPASEKTLVIILKTFWLQQDYDVSEDEKAGIRSGYYSFFENKNAVCLADLEIFSQAGNELKALTKLDYEFDLSSYRKNNLDDVSLIAFDSAVMKIQSLNVDEVLGRKKIFTPDELHNGYTKRFQLPVLTAQPAKAVFLSFEDFKQGKAGHADFRVKKGSLTDELYVKSGNSETLLLDFWGFFDGTDYYIKLGHNFFKLLRQNNTFDFMGAKNLTRYSSNYDTYAGGSMSPSGRMTIVQTKLDLKPFQLDMESGEFY